MARQFQRLFICRRFRVYHTGHTLLPRSRHQSASTFDPTRVCQGRRERSMERLIHPGGAIWKSVTPKVDNLPLAAGINQHGGKRRARIVKGPCVGAINGFVAEVLEDHRAHIVLPQPREQYRIAAKPGNGHRRIRPAAAPDHPHVIGAVFLRTGRHLVDRKHKIYNGKSTYQNAGHLNPLPNSLLYQIGARHLGPAEPVLARILPQGVFWRRIPMAQVKPALPAGAQAFGPPPHGK